MMKRFSLSLSLLFALSGCQLGLEDDGIEEPDDLVRSESGEQVIIDRDDTYDITVTGSRNVIKLENDINDVVITGDNNSITIIDDELIGVMTVAGEGNSIRLQSGLQTRVGEVIISGSNNTVTVFEYVKATFNEVNGNALSGTKVES